MLYISVFILFLSVFIFLYGILFVLFKDKMQIEDRIIQITNIYKVKHEDNESKSFLQRAVFPIYQSLSHLLLKATPKHKIAALNKKLEKAGILKKYTTEKWLYIKSMITLISSALFGVIVYSISKDIIISVFFSLIIMLFINVFFRFYIAKKIDNRKKMIIKDLPYTLDLITVSVEAGLSFDGAIARVINNINGELCDEFAKALKEIRMGIQRKSALRNMSERCDVRELSLLLTSIIQADELGVSLGKVLRIESANLREHRKQAAREKAMKAPIKMLFPLIFFIFPSIFIIILGPAVIKMMAIF